MVLVGRDDMRKLVFALDTVRKEVFGDIGDEPDVYADYDRLSELSAMMRNSVETLHRNAFRA